VIRRSFTAIGIVVLLPFNLVHVIDLTPISYTLMVSILIVIFAFIFDSIVHKKKFKLFNLSVVILSLLIICVVTLVNNPQVSISSVSYLIISISCTIIIGLTSFISTKYLFKPRSSFVWSVIVSYILIGISTASGVTLILMLFYYPQGLSVAVFIVFMCLWIILPYFTVNNPFIFHFFGKKMIYQVFSSDSTYGSFKTEEMTTVLLRTEDMDSEIDNLKQDIQNLNDKVNDLVSN